MFFVVCVQAVIVCTWKLLSMVQRDRIFTTASLIWVDAIIGAMAAAWLIMAGFLVWIGFNADDPGPVVMMFLFTAALSVVGSADGRDAHPAQAGDRAADRHGSGHLMPIVVRIDVELAKRKMSVGDFAEQVGLTPANISVLKNGRAKAVRFSTLEAMCRVLECQPGDLLEWVDE